MKEQFKKLLALILCVVLCLSLVGCKSSKDESSDDSTAADTSGASTTGAATEADANPYAEHMKISIALWGIGDYITDPSTDAVLKTIEDKFNIEIEPYAVTWTDYTEKIKLWAASNNLPDITAYEAGFTDVFDQWTSQGIVRALPSDLSNYPNVEALLTADYGKSVNKVTDDANAVYYGIPRPTFTDPSQALEEYGIAVRKDWMANVGVTELPDNIDELISLLQKFQTEDPDGNGIDDTIGLTGYDFSWMTALFTGSCPEAINGFRWVFAEDGSLEPVWKSEKFLDGIKALKKVYDAGVIDPDYIILKGEEGREKFTQGKAGAYAHSGPEIMPLNILKTGFATTYPDKNLEDLIAYLPLFADTNGDVLYPRANTSWSETYLSSNVSDDKAERCMALLDYLLSDEGYKLLSLGIEGKDYTEDADGNITLIETKKEDGTVMSTSEKYPSSGLQTLANWMSFRLADDPTYDAGIKQISKDYYDQMISLGAKEANTPDTNGIYVTENTSYDTAGGNYAKLINDLMTSDDVDKAWQKMVDDLMNSGYDKVIAEMNEKYQAENGSN